LDEKSIPNLFSLALPEPPFVYGVPTRLYFEAANILNMRRETSNLTDGSKFCSDMAVHNAIGDSFRGATSVSLHNGGGTGWGEAVNGGFLLVLDGSPAAARRARQMLHWDVFNGVSRRAWGGNESALAYTLAEQQLNEGYQVSFPHKADSALLDNLICKK
jgi:urocanate hydratase